MQSSATHFWQLMHPVQDCPDNCARQGAVRYKPTSPDGLADHHAVAAQLAATGWSLVRLLLQFCFLLILE